jgi:hypothetical protein
MGSINSSKLHLKETNYETNRSKMAGARGRICGFVSGATRPGLAQSITLGTLKGTYVTAQTGNITDQSGNLIPITIAGTTIFFGNGTASGVATFAVPGLSQRVTFTAIYSVNPDGISVSETTDPGTPNEHHFDLYPSPDGSTIASIQTDPGQFRSGVLTRSSGKALLNP